MIDELMNQITELRSKATKYENLKERNVGYTDKIKQAITLLQEVISDLNPTAYMRQGKKSCSRKEQIETLYEALQKGTELTTEKINNLQLENCDEKTAHYFMMRLRQMKKVESRKEGKKLIIYIRKNI